MIGNQYATLEPGDDYASKISPCRTFVFLHELEPLMKMNLIKGGDLDNAIVVVENPVPEEQLDHLKKLFNKPDTDRLHPNDPGHERMAKTIMYQLASLPCVFRFPSFLGSS